MLSTLTLILNIFSLLLSCQPSGVQIDRWIEIKVTRSCSFSYIVTLVKNFFTSTYSRQLFCPPAAFLPTLKLIVNVTNPAFLIDCANCLVCLKFLQEMRVTFSTKKSNFLPCFGWETIFKMQESTYHAESLAGNDFDTQYTFYQIQDGLLIQEI